MSPEEFEKELIEALKRPEEWNFGANHGQVQHTSGIYYDRYYDRREKKTVSFHAYKDKADVEVAQLPLEFVEDAAARFENHLKKMEEKRKKDALLYFLSDFDGFR